jgi:thioredoxin reductase (NADPH)
MARKLIIIGSGPAGWTAAIYAARATMEPVVFEGPEPGGQLTTTSIIENFPGFPDGILGQELMEKCREQAKKFGAEVRSESVESVDFSSQPFKVTAKGTVHEVEAVIISTGAQARRLGLESEKALYGKGMSVCATCDGFFFKGKHVIVVGGGDAAMEEAHYLTKYASKITLVHRRDVFTASKIMQERVTKDPKIEVVWNVTVEEVLGTDVGHVTGVKLRDVKTGETRELAADGVFAAIGHVPNTSLFAGQIDLDEKGYVKIDGRTSATSVPGVFACGDVQDIRYRQAVTAAGSGCMAAIDAEKFLTARQS